MFSIRINEQCKTSVCYTVWTLVQTFCVSKYKVLLFKILILLFKLFESLTIQYCLILFELNSQTHPL